MGTDLQIMALHKDGREFEVDIQLCTRRIHDEAVTVAVVRDMSAASRLVNEEARERAFTEPDVSDLEDTGVPVETLDQLLAATAAPLARLRSAWGFDGPSRDVLAKELGSMAP